MKIVIGIHTLFGLGPFEDLVEVALGLFLFAFLLSDLPEQQQARGVKLVGLQCVADLL